MPLVDVELVGSWWTFDAPTLRVHSGNGRYVELWSVGTGESAVLVPPAGQGHDWYAPHLHRLAADHVVHAVDRETGGSDALAGDLVTAVTATGARTLFVPEELRSVAEDVSRRTGVLPVVIDPNDPYAVAGVTETEVPS